MSNYFIFNFKNKYQAEYFLKPAAFLGVQELAVLHKRLRALDQEHHKLEYGILNPNLDPKIKKQFYERALLCIVHQNTQPIGFLYTYTLNEKPLIIHLGLVYFRRKTDPSLITSLYCMAHVIYYFRFGAHYVTNISHIPWILGEFARFYGNNWPNYKNYLKVPPKKYAKVMHILEKRYIRKYYDNPTLVEMDYKKFTVTEKGSLFERDFAKLKKDHDQMTNEFCASMLNYPEEENFIQVGRIGLKEALLYLPVYAPLTLAFKGFNADKNFIFPEWSIVSNKMNIKELSTLQKLSF